MIAVYMFYISNTLKLLVNKITLGRGPRSVPRGVIFSDCVTAVDTSSNCVCDKCRTPYTNTQANSVPPFTNNDRLLIPHHYIYIHNKFIPITFYLSPPSICFPCRNHLGPGRPPSLTSLPYPLPLLGDHGCSLLHIAPLINASFKRF